MKRFILTAGLNVENPFPGGRKQHYDAGTPVLVNPSGALFEAVRDKLRAENEHDQQGQAAVVITAWSNVAPMPGGHARELRN